MAAEDDQLALDVLKVAGEGMKTMIATVSLPHPHAIINNSLEIISHHHIYSNIDSYLII